MIFPSYQKGHVVHSNVLEFQNQHNQQHIYVEFDCHMEYKESLDSIKNNVFIANETLQMIF